MFKKLFTTLFIGVLSFGVFAGTINPYIEIENDGVDFAPYCTIGASTSDRLGSSGLMFSADLSYYDNELLDLTSSRQFNFNASLASDSKLNLIDGDSIAKGIEFFIDETVVFAEGGALVIESFEPMFGVKGFFGPVTGWVELAFPYTGGAWDNVVPTIGFSIGK